MSRSRPPPICRAPSVPAATRALDDGVVPDRQQVAVGGRKIRDLEVGTPEAADGSGHPADALPNHGPGDVERPRQDPYLLDGLAVPALDVSTEAAGPVLYLLDLGLQCEMALPAGPAGRPRSDGRY